MRRPSDRILPAVALMVAFCAVAPLIDVCAKLAAGAVPVGQIAVARFVVQAALMAPLVGLAGLSWRLGPRDLGLVALRAAAALGATGLFVAAVAVMPIADALAIAFVEPFLLMLMAWAVLGERVGPRRLAAGALGFAGALMVIEPGLALFGPAALFPLGGAALFALYVLLTRQLSARVHPVPMQAATALAAVAIGLPALALGGAWGIGPLDPVWPGARDLALLAGVGAAATVSHLAMTFALRLAPSATLAPLQYLEIPFAVALGLAIWGDFPAPMTWAGIAVISASGLYVIHRERLAERRRAPPARPAPPAAPAPAAAPASPGR